MYIPQAASRYAPSKPLPGNMGGEVLGVRINRPLLTGICPLESSGPGIVLYLIHP